MCINGESKMSKNLTIKNRGTVTILRGMAMTRPSHDRYQDHWIFHIPWAMRRRGSTMTEMALGSDMVCMFVLLRGRVGCVPAMNYDEVYVW